MNRLQGSSGVVFAALSRLPRLSPPIWIAALGLAAIVALFPGLWTLPALIALLGCLLMLVKPEVAVYLLTLSVPLGSLLEIEGEEFSITPTEAIAGLLVVGWALRSLARRRVVIQFTPLSIPLALMLAIVAFSANHAESVALTLKETLKWLELIVVYLFIVAEMGSRRQILALLALLLTGAVIEALMGLAQFALNLGPEYYAIGRFMRAYGTFEQPNPYAGYLGMLIPLAIGILLSRQTGWLRGYTLVALALALMAVGVSLSRGAWVGIALAVAAMSLFWSRRTRILLLAGSLLAAPLAALAYLDLLPPEVVTRLATALDYFRFVDVSQEVVTPQNFAVIERMAHWQAAINMIAAHPLLGVGAGNYPAVYKWFALPEWTEPLGHAHNFYLNIAAETGLLGLLVYLSVVGIALLHAMRWLIREDALWARAGRARPHRDLLWRGILVGVLGSLVASSVHNTFDSLFVHSMSVQLGMILALAQLSAMAVAEPEAAGIPLSQRKGRDAAWRRTSNAPRPPKSEAGWPPHTPASTSRCWGQPDS